MSFIETIKGAIKLFEEGASFRAVERFVADNTTSYSEYSVLMEHLRHLHRDKPVKKELLDPEECI